MTEFPADFYTTDAFTDRAIEILRRFTAAEQPFLLHLCYTAPHYPLHARPEDIAKYIGRYRDGWDTLRRERFARQQQMGLAEPGWKLSETDSQAYAWSTADHQFEDSRMAVYAAMIDAMDQNIGRLRTTIEQLGVADNTLILFLSDNGGCAEEPGGRDPTARRPGPKDDYVAVGPAWGWAQNTPFRRYKQWVHEGGIATPLIACWPGRITAGTVTRQVGHIIDILPTCLDLAQAEYPGVYDGHEILPVEGRSLVPVLRGEHREPHDELAWQWSGNAAIRQGPWKLVWDKKVREWELYNLAADRTETSDLASAEPQRVQELVAAYHAWADRTGHPQVDAMWPQATP